MAQPLFKKVAFIGLGLIGSSLARVIAADHLAETVVASTRSAKTLEDALKLGLISEGFSDPTEAVKGADLVVLALPVRATQKTLELIRPYLTENVILTDVGSTKGNVVEAAVAVFGDAMPAGFVPGHPIAGAEHTGVHAGKVDLFANHKVILTPLPSSAAWAVEKLTRLWQAAKAD